MGLTDLERSAIGRWDPALTERVLGWVKPAVRWYHRSEVRGLDAFPTGGVLVVSNHSGGQVPMDIPVFVAMFYEKFGYGRPVFTLSHDLLFKGPMAEFFIRIGLIPADRDNASSALRSGGVVLLFPGGDYDAFRPTSARHTIDFGGRTGYVEAAMSAGVPVVPMVSIGAQENQLYITRGEWLAQAMRLTKRRIKFLPFTFGFPFGLSAVLPVNIPLPTKIVTQVLEPIDIGKRFGHCPDVDEVDNYIRDVMQQALSQLAAERRFPVIG